MEGYRGRIAPSTPPCRRSTLRLWRIHCQWNQMYERKRRGRGWGHCCSDFGQFVGSRRALCLHLPTLFNGARSALWHPTSTLQVDPWPEPPDSASLWFAPVMIIIWATVPSVPGWWLGGPCGGLYRLGFDSTQECDQNVTILIPVVCYT